MHRFATLVLAAAFVVATTLGSGARESADATRLQPRGTAPADVSPHPRPSSVPKRPGDLPRPGAALPEPPPASDEPPRGSQPVRGDREALEAGNLFAFRVCNRSDTGARVAVTRREEGGRGWRVEGWWRVPPSECEKLGIFPRGGVYYYADATDGGSWSGSVIQMCVRYPGPFSRYDDGEGGYTCNDSERLKGFAGRVIGDDVETYTWNLNP